MNGTLTGEYHHGMLLVVIKSKTIVQIPDVNQAQTIKRLFSEDLDINILLTIQGGKQYLCLVFSMQVLIYKVMTVASQHAEQNVTARLFPLQKQFNNGTLALRA